MMQLEICSLCKADKTIICPRNVDAQCLECGQRFCGAHIGQHLKEKHFISLGLGHCRKKEVITITDERLRREILRQLNDSVSEEQQAIDVYRRRADYAHDFPSIASVYGHIREEEEHHLKEFQDLAKNLRRETK